MALGSTIQIDPADPWHFRTPNAVALVAIPGRWVTVIDAGGVATADAAIINNPDTQITASTRHPFRRGGASGTALAVRLKYSAGLTGITNPVIKVFGRALRAPGGISPDQWEIIANEAGEQAVTIATAPTTDVTDGTFKWSHPDAAKAVFDLRGCEEFLIGVQTALAGTGDVSTATLEVKLI